MLQLKSWLLWLVMLVGTAAVAAPVHLGVALPPQEDGAAAVAALDAAQTAGATLVEISADWRRIQPTATTWEFAWLDELIAAAEARGLQVMLTFGPATRWSVTYLQNPSDAELGRARPDLKAYRAYVVAVTRRYEGRVRYYRPWAPPNALTLLAVPRDVFAIYNTATEAVHTVNPDLRVVVSDPGDVNLGWLDDYLASATGKAQPDALALTAVKHTVTPEALWWRMAVLRERVLPKENAPELWVQLPPTAKLTEERRHWLAGAALLQQVSGVLLPQPNESFGALSTVASSEYAGWSRDEDGEYAGVFRADDTQTQVLRLSLLSDDEGRYPLRVDADAPAVITPGVPSARPVPVMVSSVSLDVDGLDPTGIHVRSDFPGGRFIRDRRDNRVVFITVREYDPWIHLDIPDGFLFYNQPTVPVDVTVRVYGAERARRTGFNLYYDAVDGMRYSPWQWIDVGPNKVFTYTFRLTDAVFSNREGYDLRLCMGGSDEGVTLVDMTVTKVK